MDLFSEGDGFQNHPVKQTPMLSPQSRPGCRARDSHHALDHAGINRQSCPRDGLEVKLIAGYFDEHE